MADDEERIDIGSELNGASRLDDQLLRDIRSVARAEDIKQKIDPKKAAREAARRKKINLYAMIGAIAAVLIVIVAYAVMVKPNHGAATNQDSGARRVPQTNVAAPVTTTTPATPTNVPPVDTQPAPMQRPDANGYEPPM